MKLREQSLELRKHLVEGRMAGFMKFRGGTTSSAANRGAVKFRENYEKIKMSHLSVKY